MHDLEPILQNHRFFAAFSDDHLALIASFSADAYFAAGQMVFHEGEPADTFFALYEGAVALELVVPGRGPRTVQTCHPGEVLGWAWLVPPHRRVFDAHAITPARTIVINGPEMLAAQEADHEFGYHLMRRFAMVMANRLQATRLQLLDLYGARD